VFVVLSVSCSKSEESGHPSGTAESPGEKRAPGQKPGSKPQSDEDLDIDSLDIPDQIKEAIRSGRIPKDRVQEVLARFQAGGMGASGPADPVNVEKVLRRDLNSYLVLNGIVEPERKVEIFSRLSAYVKEIVKEEGAYVRENDTLALLDDTEIKISFEQANIALEQAKLSLEEAEQNYLRYQELIKRDLVSEQEYQNQESQYKQRKLDHQNRLEDFKNLQIQLDWTKIRSLSEGYITERLIEVGDRVNANQQVYTVEDFSPLLIRVSVFEGDVKLINPRIDVQTGTVKVTVEVFDESLRLKPGMFVEVRIAIGQKENVIVIPRKAILYKQNKTFAFVLDQGTVTQREITLGLLEEDLVEVTSGLSEGDIIVSVGVEGLEDGQRVEVLR
jgi:multidrug efflux pump subunit AcrA (membrane-fusion protein)